MCLIIPEQYKSSLGVIQTQQAIKDLKDYFEQRLSEELKLTRVSSPLFVLPETGTNDNLNGVEKAVNFNVPNINKNVEIVQSLAKWKRVALKKYGFETGRGIYTDMNAIRKDEELDNIHSIYVDQWDWEKVISKEERNMETLEYTVRKVFSALKETEDFISRRYNYIEPLLPDDIFFITSQELEELFPECTPKEREYRIAKSKGAVFISQIGKTLASGKPHDGRAPDYDDWSTEVSEGFAGLNGDILVWNPVLEDAFEISSMGIRVDAEALKRQLALTGDEDRLKLEWHQALLRGEMPQTIGGGIGQSRLTMLLLQLDHIGQVQCGVWPAQVRESVSALL